MTSPQDAVHANRAMWDALVPHHAASDFYDVDAFRTGACTLLDLEKEEVGEVKGRTLLHLQCHFGLDTLSWARRGASVTGVDFSEPAVTLARSLATELNLDARFVLSDMDHLPDHLDEQFDIIFTSAGVLCWLGNLSRWGEVIAHHLSPGGIFYLREFHPFAGIFNDDRNTPELHYPYFEAPEPQCFHIQGSYADPSAAVDRSSYEWAHSLGEVLNALTAQDLIIEFLHEFPWTTYRSHPFLVQGDDRLWRYPEAPRSLPLTYSLRARKPAV